MIDQFRDRVLARLVLLPPHDPQFRRNSERVVRDAEREQLALEWVLDYGEARRGPEPGPDEVRHRPAPGGPILHPTCIRRATGPTPRWWKHGAVAVGTAGSRPAAGGGNTWGSIYTLDDAPIVREIRGLIGQLSDDEAALVRTLTPADLAATETIEHLFDLVDLLATVRCDEAMADYVYAIAPGWDGSIEMLLLAGRVTHRGRALRAEAPRGPQLVALSGRRRSARSRRVAQSMRPMRASQSPGASTSAGVGRSSSSPSRRASASSPARSITPGHEGAAAVDLVLADVEAEQPGEGLLALALLDPVAVPRLAERAGRRGQRLGDAAP